MAWLLTGWYWHCICNIGKGSELVNFQEIDICIGPRSTDWMFDLARIDLAVFLGKRHLCPDVFSRIGMSCVNGC